MPASSPKELAGLVAVAEELGESPPAAVVIGDLLVFHGVVPTRGLEMSIIRESRACLSADSVVDLLVIRAGADPPASMALSEATVNLLGDPYATKPDAPAMAKAVCARLDRLADALLVAIAERPSLVVSVAATAVTNREPGAGAFLAGSRVHDVHVATGVDLERIAAVARSADAPTSALMLRIDLVIAKC